MNIDDVMKDDTLRQFFSLQPKQVDPNSTTYFYYMDMLFRKALSVYELENVPDNWDIDYFMTKLLSRGYICVTA